MCAIDEIVCLKKTNRKNEITIFKLSQKHKSRKSDMSVACSVPRRHRIISLVAENTENDRVPDTNKRRPCWIIKMSERDKGE